ncbi:MAG: tRNA lysidine(34) synthetase TilS [bacterium]
MLSEGEDVVVAVSGGPDSICLLHLLLRIAPEMKLRLSVAHLNHMLREEAIFEEEFVRELARKYSLAFYSERINVPQLIKKGETLEEGARRIRYDFFRRASEKLSSKKVALGHTADDLVETVLLNLIRGAGLRGLRGIPPLRKEESIVFIRPLINIWRREIEEYLKEQNIPYVIDRSNLSLQFTRNKIRHQVIPLLEELNPRVKEAIHRLASIARETLSFIEEEARARVEEIIERKTGSSLYLNFPKLASLHPALQKEIVRQALEEFKLELGKEDVERILEIGRSGVATTLAGGMGVRKRGEFLLFSKRERFVSYEIPLRVPGSTDIPQAGMRIDAEIIEGRFLVKDPGCREVTLDMDCLKGGLVARNWRKGDRFVPLGMSGEKKLQDIFIDKKVPREERGRIPIVCDEEGIVWIVGVGIGERVKVKEETRRVLHLKAVQ